MQPFDFSREKELCAAYPLNWAQLDNKTLLITGATGLVGKYLIEVLLLRNKQQNAHTRIIAVGRSRAKFQERFAAYQGVEELVFLEHDVQKPWQVEEKIDFIFHMASNTHPKQYASEPVATEMANILGTHYLLELASRNTPCRFVFTSSGDIYGDNRSGKEYLEETDCGYIDCNTLRANYIEGKRASEALCNAYKEQYGIEFCIARLCRIFGDTMQMEDSKAISSFIKNAVNGEDIVLKSEGKPVFSYLHVYDVVTALLKIAADGENGNAYNVAANDHCIALRDLAAMLAEIGNAKVVFDLPTELERKGASPFMNVRLDGSKLERLGWKSQISMREGLASTVEKLRALKNA